MDTKRKGKACIISLAKFDQERELKGHVVDEIKMSKLWLQMGFDVHRPHVKGAHLTRDVNTAWIEIYFV